MPNRNPKEGAYPKTERCQLMLSQQELREIEDLRFSRRIPTRSEAIRILLKKGMEAFAREQRQDS